MEMTTTYLRWKATHILFVGDIQWAGSKQRTTALEALKDNITRHLEYAERGEQTFFLGLGDYTDFMSPSNRARLAAANLYDNATDIIDHKAKELVDELYETVLAPTRGRWLGLVEGHHLVALKNGETTDMYLAELLQAKFLGTSALIRLVFQNVGGQRIPVVIWAHHGVGSGQTGYYPLTRLEKEAADWEGVDVFAIGHTTKQASEATQKMMPRWKTPDLTHRKIILIGSGGYCVPLDAEILTRRGWQTHWTLRTTDQALGWADGSGLRWTPVTQIHRFRRQVTDRLHSRSFDVICTRSHTWETDRLRVETRALRPSDRIRVSSGTACQAPGSDVSPDEAALLAWVVTDGYVTKAQGLTIGIVQWKEPYRHEIRERVGKWIRAESGRRFLLHTHMFQELCWRLGTDPRALKDDHPWIVAGLSPEARRAWLEAALEAEGSQDAGGWSFYQNPGPVLDAFEIAATLDGWRLGRSLKRGTQCVRVRLSRRTHATRWDMKRTRAGVRDVWCPTTGTGNWIMRWRGHITLTGNSKKYVVGALQGRVARGGYAEQRMLRASIIGSPTLHLRPHRQRSRQRRMDTTAVELTTEG